MDTIGIIVLVAAIVLVVFTVAFNIIRRRKGKTSCGCEGCGGCPSAGKCGADKCGAGKGELK